MICSNIEARLLAKPAGGVRREELLKRARALRLEIDSWERSPPAAERRPVLAAALITLQREVEELTTTK